jgi:hypothetical protein
MEISKSLLKLNLLQLLQKLNHIYLVSALMLLGLLSTYGLGRVVISRGAGAITAAIYALSLENGDKSGIRSLAANFHGNEQEKTFYLLSPDKFGPTFGYYFAQHPVEFYGFARWHRPEIFSPQGYLELWNSPTLISDMEQRIQDKVRQGYRRLALIQESATVPADIGPRRSTSRANKFLSRLRQTYTLLEKTDYPGIKESVTLYLFSIVKQN